MPSFSFCRMIYKYWRSLAPSRSQSHGNLTMPCSPSCITRMRCFTATQNQYSSDHLLPLYNVSVSSVEKETLGFQPNSPSGLPKTFLGFTFEAALFMFQTMSSSPSGASQNQQAPIIGAAMVIAFAASLSGIFLSHSKPRLAAIVKMIGYLSFATGLFGMTRVFLSGSLVMCVVGWLAWGFPMLAFLISRLT